MELLLSQTPGIRDCSDVDLPLCQEWDPPNLGEFCCGFAAGSGRSAPKICVGLVLAVPLLQQCNPKIRDRSAVVLLLAQGWVSREASGVDLPCAQECVSQNSAQGLPLTQKWVPQNL